MPSIHLEIMEESLDHGRCEAILRLFRDRLLRAPTSFQPYLAASGDDIGLVFLEFVEPADVEKLKVMFAGWSPEVAGASDNWLTKAGQNGEIIYALVTEGGDYIGFISWLRGVVVSTDEHETGQVEVGYVSYEANLSYAYIRPDMRQRGFSRALIDPVVGVIEEDLCSIDEALSGGRGKKLGPFEVRVIIHADDISVEGSAIAAIVASQIEFAHEEGDFKIWDGSVEYEFDGLGPELTDRNDDAFNLAHDGP